MGSEDRQASWPPTSSLAAALMQSPSFLPGPGCCGHHWCFCCHRHCHRYQLLPQLPSQLLGTCAACCPLWQRTWDHPYPAAPWGVSSVHTHLLHCPIRLHLQSMSSKIKWLRIYDSNSRGWNQVQSPLWGWALCDCTGGPRCLWERVTHVIGGPVLDLNMSGHAWLSSSVGPARWFACFFLCKMHKEACVSEGRGLGEQDGSVPGPWPSLRTGTQLSPLQRDAAGRAEGAIFLRDPVRCGEPLWATRVQVTAGHRAPHSSEGKSASCWTTKFLRKTQLLCPGSHCSSLQTPVAVVGTESSNDSNPTILALDLSRGTEPGFKAPLESCGGRIQILESWARWAPILGYSRGSLQERWPPTLWLQQSFVKQ